MTWAMEDRVKRRPRRAMSKEATFIGSHLQSGLWHPIREDINIYQASKNRRYERAMWIAVPD
jgi:hypothetical protein